MTGMRETVLKLYFQMIGLLVLAGLILGQSVPCRAEGENDPLWRKNTYEKKVYRVGQRLLQANHITDQIAFTVDRSAKGVNAYANTQGQVVINRQLLYLVESDDELAGILGHELAHHTRRHISKSFYGGAARGVVTTIPLVLAGALLGPEGAVLGARIGRKVNHATNSGVSRGYESEADRLGLEYMYNAGYNPQAMVDIYEKAMGDAMIFRLFQDHPLSQHRIAQLEALIHQRYSAPPPKWQDPTQASQLPMPPGVMPASVQMPVSQFPPAEVPPQQVGGLEGTSSPGESLKRLPPRANAWERTSASTRAGLKMGHPPVSAPQELRPSSDTVSSDAADDVNTVFVEEP